MMSNGTESMVHMSCPLKNRTGKGSHAQII